MTAKGRHFRELAFQFFDEICALLLRICFKLYKAEAYSLVDLVAVAGAGDIEVARTATHRKTEQRANKDYSRFVPPKKWFHIKRVSDHNLFR